MEEGTHFRYPYCFEERSLNGENQRGYIDRSPDETQHKYVAVESLHLTRSTNAAVPHSVLAAFMDGAVIETHVNPRGVSLSYNQP